MLPLDAVIELTWPEVPLPEWSDYAIGLAIDTYQRTVDTGLNVLGEPVTAEVREQVRGRLAQLREEREKRKKREGF